MHVQYIFSGIPLVSQMFTSTWPRSTSHCHDSNRLYPGHITRHEERTYGHLPQGLQVQDNSYILHPSPPCPSREGFNSCCSNLGSRTYLDEDTAKTEYRRLAVFGLVFGLCWNLKRSKHSLKVGDVVSSGLSRTSQPTKR